MAESLLPYHVQFTAESDKSDSLDPLIHFTANHSIKPRFIPF